MLQDFRFALRTLLRSPGFTTTAAVTLALGIGVTSLMFSVVNAVLLRPLPYPDQDRLMLVFNVQHRRRGRRTRSAPARSTSRTTAPARAAFDALAGHIGTGFTFSGSGDPELVIGQMVTPDFFRVLGVAAVARTHIHRGRVLARAREHDRACRSGCGSAGSAASPSIVGSQVTVNGKPYTIAGVMPAGFEYPGQRYQLWAPLPSPRTAEHAADQSQLALPPGRRAPEAVGRPWSRRTPRSRRIAGALAAQYPGLQREHGRARDAAARTSPSAT